MHPSPARDRQILLIGRNSFLAREFAARCPDLPLRAIVHEDVLRDDSFAGIACVVNFAFAPALHSSEYDAVADIDRLAARSAHRQGARYVMLSSRRVYAEDVQWNAREDSRADGRDAYGRNKVRIEADLQALLGDRLTILRPGSIVGFEAAPGRQRIAAYMQNQLLLTGRIRLTVASSTRRDLVPIGFFCRVLRQVVLSDAAGVFNVGAGHATTVGDAARWLIEGFGAGELVEEEGALAIDEFQLDGAKLLRVLGLSCGSGELEECLRESGARLARQLAR